MKVSLILTVLNEADTIGIFLNSLEMQTRLPDEVVVCDAGSTDGTQGILKKFGDGFPRPVTIFEKRGNRSIGRNAAIRKAAYDLIAGTDAGCVLKPDWLERLIGAFENDPSVDVVSGFYASKGETLFEKCAGVVTLSTKGVNPDTFLPSTRSIAFRREAWATVGGFPEKLDFAEDTRFALDLRAAGMRFVFAGDAVVYWRPRNSLSQVYHQFADYARGNSKTGILTMNSIRIHARYLIWMLLTGGLVLAPWTLFVWIPAVIPYWARWSLAGWRESGDWRSLFVTPAIKLVVDGGQITGFWEGFLPDKDR
jgi:glycosyltransferase involved in cell wall biosynthesis